MTATLLACVGVLAIGFVSGWLARTAMQHRIELDREIAWMRDRRARIDRVHMPAGEKRG